MGQSMGKGNRGDLKSTTEVQQIIDKNYDEWMKSGDSTKNFNEFYHTVCTTVDDINKLLGKTHIPIPNRTKLKELYEAYKNFDESDLLKAEYRKVLVDLFLDIGISGTEALHGLFFIYAGPATTTLVKQLCFPSIPNTYFVPAVTAVTALILAQLRKI